MKIPIDTLMRNLGGEVIEEDDKPITLRIVFTSALISQNQGDKPSGEQKARRYALAVRTQQAKGDLELSVDEAAEIKKLIGLRYGPLIVGQAWEIIDPKPKVKEEKGSGEK